jgi:hypothetical protein
MAGGARVLGLCPASGGSGRFPSRSHAFKWERCVAWCGFMVGAGAQRHGFCAPGACRWLDRIVRAGNKPIVVRAPLRSSTACSFRFIVNLSKWISEFGIYSLCTANVVVRQFICKLAGDRKTRMEE